MELTLMYLGTKFLDIILIIIIILGFLIIFFVDTLESKLFGFIVVMITLFNLLISWDNVVRFEKLISIGSYIVISGTIAVMLARMLTNNKVNINDWLLIPIVLGIDAIVISNI